MSSLHLPPLFSALATAGADPFAVAVSEARAGCDAGLVTYDVQPQQLRGAMVFAPEVPLQQAAIMLPLCGVGFQNALGAIAPPEVGVHLEWGGAIRLNGAVCGKLMMAAEPHDPRVEPDWLVVSLELALRQDIEDTGETPDATTLYDEGCAEVEPVMLLEAWVRHTLLWINRWQDEGTRALHAEWQGLVHGVDGPAAIGGRKGIFQGVDEDFGMLLRTEGNAVIIPLTDLFTEPA